MNYEQLAKSILSKCLQIPEEHIKVTDEIYNLKEIDSVDFALIVAEVEKVLKKEVPIEELLLLNTVQKLVNILEKNA